jgi:hypothetical protein
MMHSASVVQLVLHAVGPQTYWSQLFTIGSEQVPLPLQVRALVCVPAMHEAGLPQVVPEATCWHFWLAVQFPVLPHSPLERHIEGMCGSGSPAATPVQVPGFEPLQVWQSPQEAVWQQTPSTHVPFAHGAPVPQWSPNPPPLVQTPPMQNEPLAQSVACVAGVHESLHPEVVQA